MTELKSDPFFSVIQPENKILGHEKQEELIHSIVKKNQMPNAWIFSGAEGIGKASFALKITKWLLGAKPDLKYGILGTDPDHMISKQVISTSHQNFMYITHPPSDKKNQQQPREIPVSEVRKLTAFFQKKLGNQEWRIALIDPIEALNINALNAILKQIEELPQRSICFLISHHYKFVLDTIKSRCIKLDFYPLSKENLQVLYKNKLKKIDTKKINPETLFSLAKGIPANLDYLLEDKGYEFYDHICNFFINLPHPGYQSIKLLTENAANSSKQWKFFQESFLSILKKNY